MTRRSIFIVCNQTDTDQLNTIHQAHYASSDVATTDPILAIITNVYLYANLEVLGLFWFDFEEPEFWAMARSDWCLMSHQWMWSEEEFSSGHTLYPTQGLIGWIWELEMGNGGEMGWDGMCQA